MTNQNKNVGDKAAEAWKDTKDTTRDAWDKTKEIASNAWDKMTGVERRCKCEKVDIDYRKFPHDYENGGT